MKQVNHSVIVTRLKRAEGHLRSVIEMFDKERKCVDLVQQLHAVEAAVANAKRQLIHDHMEHCLDDDASHGKVEPKAMLMELRALTKYL